ncbi:MAG: MoaD/ThiS family protein [Acidobacteria bacterium]|nr:MoaD/ThiS family protein [Acidobacteriota bacterium]
MAGTITVRFYALLRRRLRTPALEVEADALTVRELLLLAEKKAGQPFLDELLDAGTGLLEGTMILVNGENIRLKQKLETQVGAGDTVDLFSPAGGG